MREFPPPFQFELGALLSKARRKLVTRVGRVSINLPFLSFEVDPDDQERTIAREIVVRVADRRVLNAWECCDDCIDRALSSLQGIRSLLVDKQVELAKAADGPLYLLTELMLESIRQFLTFEQRLASQDGLGTDCGEHDHETREQYFAALEMLRSHLHRCLIQVSKIANTEIQTISRRIRYDGLWQLEAYKKPAFEDEA